MVLDLSVAQIVPKKINKMFLPKKLEFIDVLLTVHNLACVAEMRNAYFCNERIFDGLQFSLNTFIKFVAHLE